MYIDVKTGDLPTPAMPPPSEAMGGAWGEALEEYLFPVNTGHIWAPQWGYIDGHKKEKRGDEVVMFAVSHSRVVHCVDGLRIHPNSDFHRTIIIPYQLLSII